MKRIFHPWQVSPPATGLGGKHPAEHQIQQAQRAEPVTEKDELFAPKLYKKRFSIERAFAWMDAFKDVLNRFKTKAEN